MKLNSPSLLAAAILCAGAFGSSAAFAQGTFTPGSGTTANCNVGVSGTTVDAKTCTQGAVSVDMTAWGFTAATLGASQLAGFRQGRLADWDTGGFGAYTGSNESGTGNQHGFDNFTGGCGTGSGATGGAVVLSTANSGCGGSIEALYLNFGTSKINLSNIGIGFNGGDADLSVWAWTGAGGPNMLTQTAAGSTTTGGTTAAAMAGWTLVSNNDFGAGTGTQATNGTLYSSYFLVTTYFGAASGGLTAGNDSFKLNSFTAGVCSGTLTGGTGGNGSTCTPGTSVPEPTSLALVGVAMLGVTAARRRTKKA